jgi:dCTP deaminase
MSIKSDRWIRRMAAAHGMIDPFAAEQVRVVDGHKIVSYGTSSYGYDVRSTDEFKIFTNINSTIVDPKNFDEKSFVDFKGPVCIIPPNSFALASTVEFFRIPRNVLVACLGNRRTRVAFAAIHASHLSTGRHPLWRRWPEGTTPVNCFGATA